MPLPIFEYSAGGVAIKEGKGLLIRTSDLKGRLVWTFPKGKLMNNETSPQAALREVEEETGWRCRITRELPRSHYWFHRKGQRVKKTVRWFQMDPVEEVGKPDEEVDEVAWLPIQEALSRLTYQSDRDLLQRAVADTETSKVGGRPKNLASPMGNRTYFFSIHIPRFWQSGIFR